MRFLTEHEHEVVAGCADRLLPPHGEFAGGGARPGPPTTSISPSARSRSTRRGSGPAVRSRVASAAHAAFDQFIPLSRVEELAWRTRIEGSLGIAEREWNGPVRGWQEIYRDGIAALGDDFLELDGDEQDAALGAVRS